MTDAKPSTGLSGATAIKRKATFVPDSMLSYLAGALKTDFAHLKSRIEADSSFESVTKHPNWTKAILEELFRYLYLLADTSSDGVMRVAPSHLVEKALHSLLLDPVFYFQVCDAVLSLQGQDEVQPRVLPHLSVYNVDGELSDVQFASTSASYKQVFGQEPPTTFWSKRDAALLTETSADGARQVAEQRQSQAILHQRACPDDNEIIVLNFVAWDGEAMRFSVKADGLLRKAMNAFAERKGADMSSLRFLVYGDTVNEYDTPRMLELVDGDQIDVVKRVLGC